MFTKNYCPKKCHKKDDPCGTQGPRGFQGIRGLIGDNADSIQGLQGVQGTQGYDSFVGKFGAQGWQGPQGFYGAQGMQGYQGISVTGPQGYCGFIGTQGARGCQGYQGYQGDCGPQGLQGPQGWQGTEGFDGDIIGGFFSRGVGTVKFTYTSTNPSTLYPIAPVGPQSVQYHWVRFGNVVHVVYDSYTTENTVGEGGGTINLGPIDLKTIFGFGSTVQPTTSSQIAVLTGNILNYPRTICNQFSDGSMTIEILYNPLGAGLSFVSLFGFEYTFLKEQLA